MRNVQTYSEDSRPTRILLDVRDRQPTGISRYALGMVRACIHHLGPEVSLGVLCEGHQLPRLEGMSCLPQVTVLIPTRTELFARFDDAILKQISEFRPQHYHGFANFVDPRMPCPWSVTIHDLIRLTPGMSSHYADHEFAARYSESERANLLEAVAWMRAISGAQAPANGSSMRTYLELMIQIAANHSEFILTPSTTTARALRERVGGEAPIYVDPPQSDPAFSPVAEPSAAQQINVQSPYLLFVGTPGEHKRLDLVESYLSEWDTGMGPTPRLLAVGDRAGGNLYERIRHPAATGQGVERLGYVSDELLSGLYRSALAVVVPSVLEGYCLPADEALQSGGRVLASRIEVLTDRLAADRVRFFTLHDGAEFLNAVAWAVRHYGKPSPNAGHEASSRLDVPLLLDLLGHGESD